MKVIKMKQTNNSETVKAQVRRASVKKVSAVFGLMLTAAAIGAVVIYGTANGGRNITTADDKMPVATTAVTTVTAPEADSEAAEEEFSETVTWWKAGVEDYDFAEVTSAETTTTTKKATTTKKTTTAAKTTTKAAKKTTTAAKTTKKATEEKVDSFKAYATAIVNVRKGADTTYDKLGTLAEGDEVTVNGKTSNGWYKVKFNGETGYVYAEYFTTDKPKTTTTAAAKAEKKTTTTTTTAKKKAATTTAAPAVQSGSVISYTDEEYEMLCYVLQGEVGNCSEASKIAVANVVINRVKSPYFGSSIKEVLTAPNQFTAIYGYYDGSKVPSQNTRDCALRALNGEDNSNGAVYYYSPKYCGGSTAAWFESLTFCMELDGQRFFK